jgi:ribosomal 30S subunit maturation factor RimM
MRVMIRNRYLATIATAAVIAAAPALAKPGGGGMGMGGMAQGNLSAGAQVNASAHGQAVGRGQAVANGQASTKSSGRVDLDEPMTGTHIRATDLGQSSTSTRISGKSSTTRLSQSGNLSTQLSTQITPGASIADSSGATIGTVTGIRSTGSGAVKSVQVTVSSGQMITVAANSLTENGGVLTTNTLNSNVNSQGAANASINGLIHASPNSALGSAGVTTLTGLTAGAAVNDSAGASLGTVSSVLVNRSGAVVGVTVNLAGGGTATIPATSLTMNGTTVVTTSTNLTAGANTLGTTQASVGGTATANVAAGASLSGMTTGMSVVDSSGATVGTVTGIRTTGNGGVKSVQITLDSGQMINVSANSLSLNGDVLTTNSLNSNVNSQGAAHASINGLIHASPNSALASAGVTTLTGLTAGATVNDSGGTALGTVSSVLVNRSGAVVGVNVNLDAGGTVTIPATTLTMDGTTVVTTFTP